MTAPIAAMTDAVLSMSRSKRHQPGAFLAAPPVYDAMVASYRPGGSLMTVEPAMPGHSPILRFMGFKVLLEDSWRHGWLLLTAADCAKKGIKL